MTRISNIAADNRRWLFPAGNRVGNRQVDEARNYFPGLVGIGLRVESAVVGLVVPGILAVVLTVRSQLRRLRLFSDLAGDCLRLHPQLVAGLHLAALLMPGCPAGGVVGRADVRRVTTGILDGILDGLTGVDLSLGFASRGSAGIGAASRSLAPAPTRPTTASPGRPPAS